ncbi:hypothetical protein [Methylobacterium longum]|uniref:Uncharacterized protein n=1 Tax=Methylobacterium longum TaxID=767694 RepID=A0ABT8AYF3_9HYPH|nr:hypothetical protein [Methylobacterium longum]MDN3575019.1 hypothetical protein [Methylobacterium longum]
MLPPDLVEAPSPLELWKRDRPLSFHWRTRDFERIHALGLYRNVDRKRNSARDAILTEAILAHDEGRWVSYSRHKAFYTGIQRYHGTDYTYATVLSVVDELLRLSLIEEQRAASGERGRQSRFRATPRLIEGFAGAVIGHDLREIIRLKDEGGTLIDYRENASTIRMRRELEAINAFIASTDLRLVAPDAVRTTHHFRVAGAYYRPTLTPSLYRVFNRGSFGFGGRAYGWWQSLPKAYRRQLLINGEPTSEPDFVQMHASILYARRGKRLEHDVYETGEFSREDGKLAFNVALNARSLPGTITALTNKPEWPHNHQRTGALIELLKRRNAAIKEDIHADQGVRLMRLDSDIALETVRGCQKAGLPVLPVHDAMITPVRHEGRVAEIMEASAAKVLKAVSPCRVKVTGHRVPQMPSGVGVLRALVLPGGSLPSQLDLLPASPRFSRPIRELRSRLGLTPPLAATGWRGRGRPSAWSNRRFRELLKEIA